MNIYTARIILLVFIFLFADSGFAIAAGSPPQRIVSLAPVITEMLYSLGLGDQVVGVTSACDRPAEAARKTRIGSMPNPSLEAVLALKPDIVVMSREGNPKKAAERLQALGKKIYVFQPADLAGLPAAIREMGQALGAASKADEMAREMENAMQEAVSAASANQSAARKTLFIIWPKPLIVAGSGTIIDQAMELNGMGNMAAKAKGSYPRYSAETIIRQQPELIIIGAAHDEAMGRQVQSLLQQLKMLEAVKKGQVCYLGDGLYRPGARVVEGLKELKKCGETH